MFDFNFQGRENLQNVISKELRKFDRSTRSLLNYSVFFIKTLFIVVCICLMYSTYEYMCTIQYVNIRIMYVLHVYINIYLR